jgi:hypothetical protein
MQSDIGTQTGDFFKVKQITDILPPILDGVIIFASILLFLYIIVSGFQYVTSSGDKGKTEEAQRRITSGIIGLSMLVVAWAIFKIIIYFFGLESAIQI